MSVFEFCPCGRAKCHMHLGGGLQSVHTGVGDHTGYSPPVAHEWFGQATSRAVGVCPRLSVSSLYFDSHAIKIQLCVQKKNNVNTLWYFKFKLILTLKQNSRSKSDVFRAKYEVLLCSPCTPTQPPFCVFTCIFMRTHV